jgi:hypothetical protein
MSMITLYSGRSTTPASFKGVDGFELDDSSTLFDVLTACRVVSESRVICVCVCVCVITKWLGSTVVSESRVMCVYVCVCVCDNKVVGKYSDE